MTTGLDPAAAGFALRDELRLSDVGAVRQILASTRFFRPAEVEIGVELVEERLARGEETGYHFLFADERGGQSVGYACYGPVPLTVGSWDLYWIAVRPSAQGRGVGSALLAETERRIERAGGRVLWVETSGRERYRPTRAFYERHGYQVAARLEAFYAPGDAKVVYGRVLAG